MGQTVNLLAYAFGGSNPSPPTPSEESQSDSPLFCFFLTLSSGRVLFSYNRILLGNIVTPY